MGRRPHPARAARLRLTFSKNLVAEQGSAACCAVAQPVSRTAPNFSIAPFRFDVTPPLGHPLLAGLVPAAVACDAPLEAIGYVLLGAGEPVVVCAVDWAGLMNEAHLAWRTALATAAGTTPERVAVQCVHQHNAPFVCLEAGKLAAAEPDLPAMFDENFFTSCLERARHTVRAALATPRPVTHIGFGSAPVREVASNRRVWRSAAGHVLGMRASACTEPALRDLPEGTIDPLLRTIAFYDGAEKIVACHYYATHPMSYYRDGRVTHDFCGMARARRQREVPGCTQIYFTGCAGNIAAGKYNDGSFTARSELAARIYAGMVRAESSIVPERLDSVEWRTENIHAEAKLGADAVQSRDTGGRDATTANRVLAIFRETWRRRVARGLPLSLSTLRLNRIAALHLPAEGFIEYQLRAQELKPKGAAVAVAAYGDDGPWYIPTREEYPAGGYEVSAAFCAESIDERLTEAMRRLLN